MIYIKFIFNYYYKTYIFLLNKYHKIILLYYKLSKLIKNPNHCCQFQIFFL